MRLFRGHLIAPHAILLRPYRVLAAVDNVASTQLDYIILVYIVLDLIVLKNWGNALAINRLVSLHVNDALLPLASQQVF
jgi:hypothetical protein